MLNGSAEALTTRYDLALLDLDGVVYIGGEPVVGAPHHLGVARQAGMQLSFVTNNASRTPEAVARHLSDLGIESDASEVVTSAQAAARLIAERVDPGATIYVIGGTGLIEAVREAGLSPTQRTADDPVAVVSGYHRDVTWGVVMDGAMLVREGVLWVASNLDLTVPTPRGPGPGNGVLVGAVAGYAGREPLVAGKPEPTLFHETLRRTGARSGLVVGDRIDTDIDGAIKAGLDSLLVMTGVTGLEELVAIPTTSRPTFVSSDLGGLSAPHPPADEHGCASWRVDCSSGQLHVQGSGSLDDWWRAVAAAAWSHLDTTGSPVAIPEGCRPGSVT